MADREDSATGADISTAADVAADEGIDGAQLNDETAPLIQSTTVSHSTPVTPTVASHKTNTHRCTRTFTISLLLILALAFSGVALAHHLLPAYVQKLVAESPPPRVDSLQLIDVTDDGARVRVGATLDAQLPRWTHTWLGVQSLRVGSTVWSLHFLQLDVEQQSLSQLNGPQEQWVAVGEMAVPPFEVLAAPPESVSITALDFESRLIFYDGGAAAARMVAQLKAGLDGKALGGTRFKLRSAPSMDLRGGWLPFSWNAVPLCSLGALDAGSSRAKFNLDALNVTVEPSLSSWAVPQLAHLLSGDSLAVSFNNVGPVSTLPHLIAIRVDIVFEGVHFASAHLFNITLAPSRPYLPGDDKTGHVRVEAVLWMDRPDVPATLGRLYQLYSEGAEVPLTVRNMTVYRVLNANAATEVPVAWLNGVVSPLDFLVPVRKPLLATTSDSVDTHDDMLALAVDWVRHKLNL